MKALGAIKLFTISFFILGLENGLAQEYDDLYFNASDRKKAKVENTVVAKNTTTVTPQSPAVSTQTYGDETVNYSAKHVNPEYIARYKSAPADESATVNKDSENSYYVEDYDQVAEYPDEQKLKHSNYYPYQSAFHRSCDPWLARNYYGRSYYDPFWGMNSSPGWNMGLGYTFGSMSGWNMYMSYGSGGGWGYNPYSYYGSPYGSMYDPWSSYMYDPWYSGSYYSSYSCYNPWRNPYRYAYSNPYNRYYGGYYGGGSVFYSMSPDYGYNSRNIKLAKRTARGSNTKPVSGNINRTNHYSQSPRTTENGRAKIASTEKQDYSQIQNEYYGRSRNKAYSRTNNRSSSNRNLTSTSSNRSSVGTTSTTRTRATREKSNYSRPTYKSDRSSRSSSYNRLTNYSSGSNSRNTGYQRSSNSSSRSYSNSGRYSGGSRSSSYSSGSRSSSSGSSGRSSSSRGRGN